MNAPHKPAPIRSYERIRDVLQRVSPVAPRLERMQAFCDAAWAAFGLDSPAQGTPSHPVRISWIGFYEKKPDADEMILTARRDKPACSPIGLHGACGQSWSRRTPLVITDVKALGEGYIACDPRDQSELVIPLFCSPPTPSRGAGFQPASTNPPSSHTPTRLTCWGVLDADSYEKTAFDAHDVEGITALLENLGLTTGARPVTAAI